MTDKKQWQVRLRDAKRIAKDLQRRTDTKAMQTEYRKMADWFRPLGKLLDPEPKMERADQQKQLQTALGPVRAIRRMTADGYLANRARSSGINDVVVSQAAEDLVDAVAKLLRYWDRIAAYESVQRELRHGPFTIVNRYGYAADEMAKALAMLDKVMEVLRRAGFKHLLYGTVRLGGKTGQHSGAANYSQSRDDITIDMDKAHTVSEVGSLVHEFGHRHWFVSLNDQERDGYEDAWSSSAPNAVDLAARERYWDAWKQSGYNARKAAGLVSKEDRDRFRMFLAERRKHVAIEPRDDFPEDMAHRQFVMPSQRYYYLGGQPQSVTRYGSTDVKEDFAEVFMHHVMGLRLTPDARERFGKAVARTSKARVTARRAPAWTIKRFLEEKTRQAVNIKRAENYLDQAFDQGADPKELQRLLTVYRNDIIASPYASGGFIRPLEEKAWGQAVDYSMFEYSVEFLRDKMIPTMQFQLSKGDVAAAKRVWDMREKKADDPAKLLRDAIKDMRGRKWMEPVFKFGAFTILNDAGISEGHAKHLFEAMTNVERLLKSKGLGYLLNGVMYLTHAGERFDAAYMPRNDRVEINYSRGQTVNSMTRALVHELGHRLWFKFMDTGARDSFAKQWLEKGEDTEEPGTRLPSVTPYGTKNRHEDFAETFTEVVMGKQKDRRLAERLQAVIPKGRVLSSVTADVDAMNQFVQSARQALVPIQKAEDKVIALIEKWAMNGVVNMRQLKMALTAHNKAVAQLNKLNLPANLRPGEREILQDMINTVNFFNVEDVERETKEFKKNLDKMEPGKALARFRNRIGGVAKQVGTMSIPNLIEKAQEFVEPELKFGPFTVIDNHGILKVRARYWFEVITRGSKILKQKGFGYLLYGNLKLEPEEKGYNGTYYSYGDYIRLNTGEQGRPNDRMLYTFIHELGHRLWFKFMDAGARDRFANPWLVQEEQLPAILKRANELLAFPSGELEEGYGVLVDSDFAYAKFMGWVEKKSERKVRWMKLLSRVYALSMSETEPFSRDNELNKKAFELTRQQIKKRKDAVKSRDAQIWGGDLETEEERIRAAQQRAQKRLDSDMRMFRKDFDKAAKDRVAITMYDLRDYFEPARSDVKAPFGPVIKDAMKLEKIKPSVTDYGQTNRMEDFAEVFAQTILGINKDRAVQQRLQAVLPKGRVMAGVLPSLHNLVQDAKFGIETDHKEMVKKARAWQRFRDNNMRKYDAFVAKHGDEAVFCEICWKGTLRSKAHVVMADEDLHVNAPNSRPRYIGPTCWKLLGPTIRPYEVKQPVSAGYVGTVELTAEQLTRALWGKPIDYINKGVYEGTGIPWRKVPKDAKLTVEIGRGGGMVRDSDGGWIADRFGPELGHRDAQKVAKQMGLATASAVGQNWFGPFGQRYRIVEDTGDGWRVEIQHSSSDLPAEESWTFTKQQFERLKESLPLSRSAEATAAPEMPFNVGDEVLFGKYKNKRGRIVQFGKNPKGQVTVQIEPIPKGRKKTKEMGLFKIWTTPGAVEAVVSKHAGTDTNASETETFWRFVDKAAARFDQFPEWMFHREPVDAAPKLLYHGTRGPLAASIVNKGLRSDSGFSNFGGQAGVSFTRDLQTAKQFGNFIVAVDPKRLQAAGYELQDVQHPTAPDEAEVRVTKGRVTVVPAGLFEKVLLVRPQGFELKWWAKTQPNLKVEVANVTAATAKPPLKELARSNKTFKGPNGNELAGYQWVSRIEDVYSKREDGLVSKRVSDWDKAVPCSTCRRNIVHVYWVKDQAGKFEPYGADHLHVGLGYPRELRKAEIERLRQRVTDVSVQQKEEGAHRKKYEQYVKIRAVPLTGNPIREANMRFLQSGGQGKPPPTFLVNRKTKQVMRADDLALDRFVALMPGWERETPAAIKEMAVGTVTAATDELYHTTSLQGLAKILQSRTFRSGAHGGFISFSEKPLFGDISAGDAVIVLDKGALRNRVMPVEYTERWFDRYPEHAEYIAGEGWREQYMEPEDCYDEEGWAGDECLERAYRGAELEAFLWKKDEREWVGRSEGDIRLPAEAFKRIVVPKAKYQVALALLKKLGLKMDVKVLRGKSEAAADALDTEQSQEDEATAIETPKKYRNRTGRCPPGHKSNEKETCIDMKERRKKRRWEKQQRDKERREAGR